MKTRIGLLHGLLLCCLLLTGRAGAQNRLDAATGKAWVQSVLQDEALLDSLVTLAWQNSYWIKGFEAELGQQHENVRQEKNRWVSSFRMGVNFFSVNTQVNANNESVTTAGLFPQLGLTLSIDPERFISRSSYIREARLQVVRAENQVLHQRRQLRLEIVQLFYQYLETLGILELREQSQQTQQEQCALLEEKFKRGEVQLEAVLLNQNALALAHEAVLRAEVQAQRIRQEINLLIQPTEGQPDQDQKWKH